MSIGQLKINAIRLVGGTGVLDYLNTCNGRRPGTALHEVVDKLSSLEDVVHWFRHAGLIDAEEHLHLTQLVSESSWRALPAFQKMIAFRESLYALFLPIALGHPVDPVRLDELNEVLAKTAARRQLVSTPCAIIWRWRPSDGLESMTAALMGRIAVEAAALLTSPGVTRLKACATPDCDWLFIDISKNGRRRWCQMNICGAREKARRTVGHA